MPTYTFLLFRRDNSALTLDVAVLDNDDLGAARAEYLLKEHRDCEWVEIWDDDRAVPTRRRAHPTNWPQSASTHSTDTGAEARRIMLDPPQMTARPLKNENGWFVLVQWPDGRSIPVSSFADESEAATWIVNEAGEWLRRFQT